MMLHHDKELFEEIILQVSEHTGIEVGIIEKDYFVTLVLKEIANRIPNIIFKGGTSLSKCYRLIKRFSEDIDLTLEYEDKVTEGQRKKLKATIVEIIDDFGLVITNLGQTRSRRDFNKYIVDFPSVFETGKLKQHLQIETMIKIKAYPSEVMDASSLIYDYLLEQGYQEIIEQYDLYPFQLKVQSAERTFVDKVFALMDYYLSGRIAEHSRHIYDLYKLIDIVEINDDLKRFFGEVRMERRPYEICLSAQDEVDTEKVLDEIISKEAYKADYTQITESLLFEKVGYDEAIKAIRRIKNSTLFKK